MKFYSLPSHLLTLNLIILHLDSIAKTIVFILHLGRIAKAIVFRCSRNGRLSLPILANSINETTLKRPINGILSEAEECNRLLMRILRLRSVSGFH